MSETATPGRAGEIPALLHYDAAVDWPRRLARELPFLEQALGGAPSRRLLDLGCGTGEHLRALADAGFAVVGIEGVPARWEVAQQEAPEGAEVLLGDLGAVEAMVRGQFGAAICLGSTFPALLGAESMARMLVGLRRRLLPGGILVGQQLSFDRLERPGVHELPPRRLEVDGETLVFRRRMEIREDGVVQVAETAHREGPEAPPFHRRHLAHQGWRAHELRLLLETARFPDVRFLDGWSDRPFDPARSDELVVVAR